MSAVSPDLDDLAGARAEMHNGNRLKLGLFGANCSSGRAATMVPERWSASWEDTLALARDADEAGIDFMLPIGRWKGYEGRTQFNESTFESITWATGILASTRRMTVFATVHVPLLHPVVACKQMVTADHIGQGRFALNVVCGWNEEEFGMFGATLREHEQRYDYADEWVRAVKAMWQDGDVFDFSGTFFQLRGVYSKPKPYGGGRPLMMNAGTSPTGQGFAARHCDALFCSPPSMDVGAFDGIVENIRRLGAETGRSLRAYTVGVVVCRETAAEAEEYYRYAMIEQADTDAMDAMIATRTGRRPETIPADELSTMRQSLTKGWGGVLLVGSPDDIAARFAAMSQQGIAGIGLSFVNYGLELPFFRDEVLPRLEKLGLRAPT